MFSPPNPLKNSVDNREKATQSLGPFSREETMQLTYASFVGTGVILFLHSQVSIGGAFIAGLLTALGFYLLLKKAEKLAKK